MLLSITKDFKRMDVTWTCWQYSVKSIFWHCKRLILWSFGWSSSILNCFTFQKQSRKSCYLWHSYFLMIEVSEHHFCIFSCHCIVLFERNLRFNQFTFWDYLFWKHLNYAQSYSHYRYTCLFGSVIYCNHFDLIGNGIFMTFL